MNRRLRVLSVINELYFGGDENRLLTMARTIDKDRFEVTVVTLKGADAKIDSHYGTMREQYATAGVKVLDLGEGHPNEGLSSTSAMRLWHMSSMFWRAMRSVCRLIRTLDIDIVDAHLGPGNLVGVAAGVLTRTPRVVTTYHVEQWRPYWLWYCFHQWTLAMASAILTDSQACADQIRRWMRKRDPAIVIIPNGVVRPSSDRSLPELRAIFGLPQDPGVKIVGQVSTLLPTKGHLALIDAAAIVRRRLPDTAFLIVGYVREDPSYKDRLEARIEELGLHGVVRIVSYPGPIGDVWKAIDVQAHPTTLDSLPNAIIEAMSLGRPAVVTAVGGIPTLVEDGVSGFVVRPGDVEALAERLIRILGDANLAARMGEAARRKYDLRYTPEAMTGQLEALFERLATMKRRPVHEAPAEPAPV